MLAPDSLVIDVSNPRHAASVLSGFILETARLDDESVRIAPSMQALASLHAAFEMERFRHRRECSALVERLDACTRTYVLRRSEADPRATLLYLTDYVHRLVGHVREAYRRDMDAPHPPRGVRVGRE